jgi:hypothetical protein
VAVLVWLFCVCGSWFLQHEKSLKRLEKAKAGIEKDKQG